MAVAMELRAGYKQHRRLGGLPAAEASIVCLMPCALPSILSHVPAGLITDLRELPSKQALQLRSDAANTANTVGNQAKVLDKALRRVAKQYGL